MHLTASLALRSLLLLSLLVTSRAGSVGVDSNKWTSIGPYMGSILCMAIDPSSPKTIYVGTFGAGIFKTTDGGSSWSAANDGVILTTATGVRMTGFLLIGALAIDRTNTSTIFAGTPNGVLKTNGGGSWAVAKRDRQINALMIAPSKAKIIYAGLHAGDHQDYVLKTTDGGASWTAIKNELIRDEILAIAIDPTNPNAFYVGSSKGVFKTSDGGTNWAAAKTWLPGSRASAIAIDPSNSNTLYAATYRGIFKSTDGGVIWNAINQGLRDHRAFALTIDASNNHTVFAGLYDGLSKSTDGGASWNAIAAGFPDVLVRAIELHSSSVKPSMKTSTKASTKVSAEVLYAAISKGVFLSKDGGESWADCSTGINNAGTLDLVIDPFNTSMLYTSTIYGVVKSTNAGASWTIFDNGIEPAFVSKFALDRSNPGNNLRGHYLGIPLQNYRWRGVVDGNHQATAECVCQLACNRPIQFEYRLCWNS